MTIRALANVPLSLTLCLAGLFALSSPLRADEIGDLDALSRATDNAKTGLALAREQISGGDLSGAFATLERLQINHPESNEAQLLHASLLCRLDDRAGAQSEFAALKKGDFRGQVWRDANAPCQAASAASAPVSSNPANASGASRVTTAPTTTPTTDANDDASEAVRNSNRRRRPGY